MIYTNEIKPTGTFRTVFDKALKKATVIDICVGYCAWKTLDQYISRLVEVAKHGRVRLILGMYRLEGSFGENLYKKLLDLNLSLKQCAPNNGSGVYITQEDCHAKIWDFSFEDRKDEVWVGSNNFSDPGLANRLEACIKADNADAVAIRKFISSLLSPNKSVTIDKVVFTKQPTIQALKNLPVFHSLPQGAKVIDSMQIPLNVDVQPKSGLNLCLGKGRLTRDKNNNPIKYDPRPWYEIEISSDETVTSHPIYPKPKTLTTTPKKKGGHKINHAQEFTAYLKHGNTYRKTTLRTYSDNNKALASTPRSVLGEFIKGNLEKAKLLKQGEPVTSDILKAYSRTSLTLTLLSNGEYVLEF